MAFDNEVFPAYPLIQDVRRDTIYPVKVRTNGTVEKRITHVRYEKFQWTIPTQIFSLEDKNRIRNFLVQRNHGLNSFKFNDPHLPELNDAILANGSGTNQWKLFLPFDDNTPGDLHPLWNLDLSEITVTVNGSPVSLTPGSAPLYNENIPEMIVPGSSAGDTVRISGKIYFTVKLATPLSQALVGLDYCNQSNNPTYFNMQPITLVEVHGEYPP